MIHYKNKLCIFFFFLAFSYSVNIFSLDADSELLKSSIEIEQQEIKNWHKDGQYINTNFYNDEFYNRLQAILPFFIYCCFSYFSIDIEELVDDNNLMCKTAICFFIDIVCSFININYLLKGKDVLTPLLLVAFLIDAGVSIYFFYLSRFIFSSPTNIAWNIFKSVIDLLILVVFSSNRIICRYTTCDSLNKIKVQLADEVVLNLMNKAIVNTGNILVYAPNSDNISNDSHFKNFLFWVTNRHETDIPLYYNLRRSENAYLKNMDDDYTANILSLPLVGYKLKVKSNKIYKKITKEVLTEFMCLKGAYILEALLSKDLLSNDAEQYFKLYQAKQIALISSQYYCYIIFNIDHSSSFNSKDTLAVRFIHYSSKVNTDTSLKSTVIIKIPLANIDSMTEELVAYFNNYDTKIACYKFVPIIKNE